MTFQPLGTEQLKKILDIELNLVQQRIFNATAERAFVFTMSDSSKNFLLEEGTDMKYGARHLKRAIERLLVQPICSLIATGQVREGDSIRVDWNRAFDHLTFTREAEGLPFLAMTDSLGRAKFVPALPTSRSISFEAAKAQARFSETT